MASGVNSIPSIPFFKTGLERGRIQVQSGDFPGLPVTRFDGHGLFDLPPESIVADWHALVDAVPDRPDQVPIERIPEPSQTDHSPVRTTCFQLQPADPGSIGSQQPKSSRMTALQPGLGVEHR
jgi:hypothetical protein